MKKNKLFTIASTVLLSTIILGNVTANAETEVMANPTTKGYIKFKASDKVTKPTDPTDPKKPGEIIIDGEDGSPGTNGPLSIDFAPNLTFTNLEGEEEVEISSTDTTYFAKALNVTITATDKKEKRPNFVQVTDNRGGAEGWQLYLTQKEQFKTIAEVPSDSKELTGATITFTNGNVKNIGDSEKPTLPTKETEVNPGEKIEILSAAKDQGAGTNVLTWGNDDTKANSIKLFVPGSTTKYAKAYSTDLEWTLANTPGNK